MAVASFKVLQSSSSRIQSTESTGLPQIHSLTPSYLARPSRYLLSTKLAIRDFADHLFRTVLTRQVDCFRSQY